MGGLQSGNGLAVFALFTKPSGTAANPRPESQRDALLCDRYGAESIKRGSRALGRSGDPEPLTNHIVTNPAAARAADLWNIGQTSSRFSAPAPEAATFATVSAWSVRSLDVIPQDRFTDSPPFLSTDAFTLNPVIPEEMLVPQITLHTVAFWKTFLQGDHRYMRYLTARYARRHHLHAVVFKIDK
jgi:hypothetical protein